MLTLSLTPDLKRFLGVNKDKIEVVVIKETKRLLLLSYKQTKFFIRKKDIMDGQNGNDGLHYTPYSLNIDQEYPPHIVVESVLDKNVEAVKAAFTERAKKGYEKYGTTTERKDIDLKGWLQHLQEELMDAVVYIEKIKSEINDLHSVP